MNQKEIDRLTEIKDQHGELLYYVQGDMAAMPVTFKKDLKEN